MSLVQSLGLGCFMDERHHTMNFLSRGWVYFRFFISDIRFLLLGKYILICHIIQEFSYRTLGYVPGLYVNL